MKILTISDVHNNFNKFRAKALPEADLCLIAGDLTNWGIYNVDVARVKRIIHGAPNSAASQLQYIDRAKQWLEELSKKYPVLWITGNHDIGIDGNTFGHIENVEFIHDRRVTRFDKLIWGINYSPCYDVPDWKHVWLNMTDDLSVDMHKFEEDYADIVLSHSPPFECLDGPGKWGSRGLRRYIEEKKPKLVVCGHIHEDGGQKKYLGDTLVVNCAGREMVVDI